MAEQSFLRGAFILMIANFINRVLGFVLRITLVRFVGDEALGLFQMAYPIFTSLLIICTAGLPVAIAKLIPEEMAGEENKDPYKYIKITLIFVGILSVIITVGFMSSARFVASKIITDQRTFLTIIILAPALIFNSLATSLRGFFQGLQDMSPTASSQITEQICRFLATILILNFVSVLDLKYQAAGIACGLLTGELCGFLLLVYIFVKFLYTSDYPFRSQYDFLATFKEMTKMGFPVALGKLVNSLMWSAEAVLIPRQLHLSGLNKHQAASLFGQLTGMVEPVIFLPTVITIALNKSLLPRVSAEQARNNYNKIKNIHYDILRISSSTGFLVTTICILAGNDICYLLYKVPEAGTLLTLLGLSAPFIYYYHVSSGMLQGLGHPQIALVNLSVGSIVKIIGIYYLTPTSGINGAVFSIIINYVVACLLNFIVIRYFIKDKFRGYQIILKPLLASAILFLIHPQSNKLLHSFSFFGLGYVSVVLNLFFLTLVYLAFLFISGAFSLDDLKIFRKK